MINRDDVVLIVWHEICHENMALFADIGGFESYDELVSIVAVCNDCECGDVGIADILTYCHDNQQYMYKDCVREYMGYKLQ